MKVFGVYFVGGKGPPMESRVASARAMEISLDPKWAPKEVSGQLVRTLSSRKDDWTTTFGFYQQIFVAFAGAVGGHVQEEVGAKRQKGTRGIST